MMKQKERITGKAGSRLIGALIGLVRATDGATHVTRDTFDVVIEGLHWSDINIQIDEKRINDMVEGAHADKHLIVPDCSVCASPCGRTADFDWESVYKGMNSNDSANVDMLKIQVLSSLQRIAHEIVYEMENGQQIDTDRKFLIYRAVFSLGEQWTVGEMMDIIQELN